MVARGFTGVALDMTDMEVRALVNCTVKDVAPISRCELSILLIHTWRASVIPVDISYGEAESNGGVVSETCHSHMCPFSPPFAGSSLMSERLCL